MIRVGAVGAIETFRTALRQLGVRRTLARSLYKLARKAAGVRILVFMDFVEERLNRSLLTLDSPYECRFLRPEEVRRYADDPANNLPQRFVRAALEKGDECCAVLLGEELASFGWYSAAPTVGIGELLIVADDTHVYMYHGYTKPEHRGHRLHGAGLARALVSYGERGKAGIVSFFELTNYRSEWSATRVGFRRAGYVLVVSIRSRRWVWASPGCARRGVLVRGLEKPPVDA